MDPRVFCSGGKSILNWPLCIPMMRKLTAPSRNSNLGFSAILSTPGLYPRSRAATWLATWQQHDQQKSSNIVIHLGTLITSTPKCNLNLTGTQTSPYRWKFGRANENEKEKRASLLSPSHDSLRFITSNPRFALAEKRSAWEGGSHSNCRAVCFTMCFAK